MAVVNHGYDVEFVIPQSDDITCAICICTLREPVQANPCGHRFCKGCINYFRKDLIGSLICPNDLGEIQVFPDIGKQREILNLKVKCTNNRNGCIWTGELRSLEDHINLCENETIKCENISCNEVLQRHKMIIHFKSECQCRIVQCQYCLEEYVYINKMIHEDECDEFPLECENYCGENFLTVPRKRMKLHIENDCPNTVHQCQFKTIGCNGKGTKASLQEHMKANMSEHLHHAINKLEKYEERFDAFENALKEQHDVNEQQNQIIKEQSNQLTFQENQINALSVKVAEDTEQPAHTCTWVITDFRNSLRFSKNENNELLSQEFYCLQGYKGQLVVNLNGNGDGRKSHVSVFFRILKGENDNELSWPFKCIQKFTVIGNGDNKIEQKCNTSNASKSTILASLMKPTTLRNVPNGYVKFISHKDINKYIVKDTFTIHVDVTSS